MQLSSLLISVPWFSRRMQVSFVQLPRWGKLHWPGSFNNYGKQSILSTGGGHQVFKKTTTFFVLSLLDFRVNLLPKNSLGLLANVDTTSHSYL